MRIAIIAITTRSSMSVKPRRKVIHRPFREIRKYRAKSDSKAGSRSRTGCSSSGEERLPGGMHGGGWRASSAPPCEFTENIFRELLFAELVECREAAESGAMKGAAVDNSGVAATLAGRLVGSTCREEKISRRGGRECGEDFTQRRKGDAETQEEAEKRGEGWCDDPGFHSGGMTECRQGVEERSDDTPGTDGVARRPWRGSQNSDARFDPEYRIT